MRHPFSVSAVTGWRLAGGMFRYGLLGGHSLLVVAEKIVSALRLNDGCRRVWHAGHGIARINDQRRMLADLLVIDTCMIGDDQHAILVLDRLLGQRL